VGDWLGVPEVDDDPDCDAEPEGLAVADWVGDCVDDGVSDGDCVLVCDWLLVGDCEGDTEGVWLCDWLDVADSLEVMDWLGVCVVVSLEDCDWLGEGDSDGV
jgi:hypothetical protein